MEYVDKLAINTSIKTVGYAVYVDRFYGRCLKFNFKVNRPSRFFSMFNCSRSCFIFSFTANI